MKLSKLLGLLLCGILTFSVLSCDKENEPVNPDSDKEQTDKPSTDNGGSKHETVFENTMSNPTEAILVGKWQGWGPYPISTGYSYRLDPGVYDFRNDHTFVWHKTYDNTPIEQGLWRYVESTKTLITEGASGTVWEISEIDSKSWVGYSPKFKATKVFHRQEDAVTCSECRIIDYKPNMLVLRDTLLNYAYNLDKISCGVCYSNDKNAELDEFSKIYASDIKLNGEHGIFDITLSGLQKDGEYRLSTFAKLKDGSLIYGPIYKAICVTPPEDSSYFGEPVENGQVTFWSDKYLNNSYEITAEPQMVPNNLQEFYSWVDVLNEKSLWSIPTTKMAEKLMQVSELEPRESNNWTASDKLTIHSKINENTMEFPYAYSSFIDFGNDYDFSLPLLVENGCIKRKEIEKNYKYGIRKPAFGFLREKFVYIGNWKLSYNIYVLYPGSNRNPYGEPAFRPVQSIKVQW